MLSGSLNIGLLPGLSDDSKDAICVWDLQRKQKGSPEAKASREDSGSREEKKNVSLVCDRLASQRLARGTLSAF
eukprot:5165826-Prorocentrum_lima.AAC.1